MKTLMKRLCGAAMIAASAIGFIANANAQGDQQVLVDQATTTLNNFMRDPEMKWLQQNIGRAKAVLISPEIVKAAAWSAVTTNGLAPSGAFTRGSRITSKSARASGFLGSR